jgi:signal transduction histidine kinase
MFSPRGLLASVRAIDRVRVDRLVAAVLLVEIELQVWLDGAIHARVFAAAAGVLLALAVAVRRRWPQAGVLVVLALMSERMLVGHAAGLGGSAGVSVSVLLLFYGLGAFAPERRSLWTLAAAVVVTSANAWTKPGGGPSSAVPMELFAVLLPYVLGRMTRKRADRERAARGAAEQLDAARDSRARAAADGERARIAREIHDVIAHSVSVMVIQAGGARLVMGDEPKRAEESLRSVERAGREALAEMRRLLGILGDGDLRALTPQPGLANIAPLLAHARTAGVSADLDVDGDPTPVPPALDLCAYRIVQEALTNTIKHAAPARASVKVRWEGSTLELEISDDGKRGRAVNGTTGGHGITGMRERVALQSGTLEAGARSEGGFTVLARLPLAPEDEP